MTQPTQPGQPYGQPPQGPYPQQGPPRQGPPPGPPFHGPPGYPFPGGFGPPPKKNKQALWISLTVGLVVIVILMITGFVAPGFFLNKDAESSDGAGSPAPISPVPTSGAAAPGPNIDSPQAAATQFVDSFNNSVNPDGSYNPDKNQASLDIQRRLKCPKAMPDVKILVRAQGEVNGGAKLQIINSQLDSSDPKNTVFTVTSSIRKLAYDLVITSEAGKPCVSRFVQGAGQAQEVPDGQTAVEKMLAAINAKDVATANSLSCSGEASRNVDGITQAIKGASSWQPDPSFPKPPSPTTAPYLSSFNGKVDGQSKRLLITAGRILSQGWCMLEVSVI